MKEGKKNWDFRLADFLRLATEGPAGIFKPNLKFKTVPKYGFTGPSRN